MCVIKKFRNAMFNWGAQQKKNAVITFVDLDFFFNSHKIHSLQRSILRTSVCVCVCLSIYPRPWQNVRVWNSKCVFWFSPSNANAKKTTDDLKATTLNPPVPDSAHQSLNTSLDTISRIRTSRRTVHRFGIGRKCWNAVCYLSSKVYFTYPLM